MINPYFQADLLRLREQGEAFSKAHPALAPLLSGEINDPDVERILEGTAFLSGLIHEKLDDELPEVIYNLLQLLAPHYLRSIPSATLIQFTPKRALRECLTIPRGTKIHSIQVEETNCVFSTSADIVIAPLSIKDINFQRENTNAVLRIDFHLEGMQLENLNLKELRLHCSGNYMEAAQRYMILNTCTQEIHFIPSENGKIFKADKKTLKHLAFSKDEALLTYPPNSFEGFRHLQEYYYLPERFCTFAITNFDSWKNRGTGDNFSIEFHLTHLPEYIPQFKSEDIQLFVTPAINLFEHSGSPILLTHKEPSYLVQALDNNNTRLQIYSIDKVIGIQQGSHEEREYLPFLTVNPSVEITNVFSVIPKLSPITDTVELWLSIAYAQQTELTTEILSINVQCTNGDLPEKLHVGDVCKPSANSPELAEFKNIKSPTPQVQPPLGKSILWRLLSHLYLNFMSLGNKDNLQSLLKLYLFSNTKDKASLLANINRIEGIEEVEIKPVERFVRDRLMRGQHITLTLKNSSFSSVGDMYIFASVLDVFFSNYTTINTYTKLTVKDTHRIYEWTERLGDRILL